MEDSEITSGDPINLGNSYGIHLKTYQSGSGLVEDDFALDASMYFFAPGGAEWRVGLSFAAVKDDRGVTVSSSADTTYSRAFDKFNNPYPKANIPDAGGVTHADQKAAAPGGLFGIFFVPTIDNTYKGNAFGNWQNNSQFNWSETLTGAYPSGYFSMPRGPLNFPLSYSRDQAPPKSISHVKIECVDSVDGAKATGNYFVTFHSIYEDWVIATDIQHPRPFLVHKEDWSPIMVIDNPTDNDVKVKFTKEWKTTLTEKVTIGAELSAGSEGAIEAKNSVGIEVGRSDEYKVSTEYEFVGARKTFTRFYIGLTWEDMSGICSGWGGSGYINDYVWTGMKGSTIWSMYPDEVLKY